MVILVGNSYSRIRNLEEFALEPLEKALTYKNTEVAFEKKRIFIQMEKAKRYGNRRMFFAMKAQLADLPPETVCLLKDTRFPTGLLDLVKKTLKDLKISFKVVDKREPPGQYLTLRWDNRPPKMRYYQEDMTEIARKHERGVFEAAVGSGKSRVITEIIKEHSVNTLIIVPSLALQEQLARTLIMAFGTAKVGIYSSASLKTKKKFKPIRICNVQSLGAMQKKGKVNKILEDIDMLIVDEVHHAGAQTYTDLLEEVDHIYYRYGFTGTFLRNDSRTMEMHGFLHNRLYHYPPEKATQEGFLTPVKYVLHHLNGMAYKNYQKEYTENYCNNGEIYSRIADIIEECKKDQQILVLIERKEDLGERLVKFLKEHRGIDCSYISGDNKKEEINNTIESFNDKKIRVLIGSKVIGEGVDVHSCESLILATGGKSEISFIQACGRAVRLSPGKQSATIHDFSFDGSFYLQSHAEKRRVMFEQSFVGKVQER